MTDHAARVEAERIVAVYQHVHGRHGAPASCPSCRGLIDAIAAALSAAAPGEAERQHAERAVIEAARDVACYDDFGDDGLCHACAPLDAADYLAARQRLHGALRELADHPAAPASLPPGGA